MRLDEINNYRDLRKLLAHVSWQRFEEIVGKIFELHGYEVKVGQVITFEGTRRQYDVLARQDHCIIADCKRWDRKRRIKYGLKQAAEAQRERVQMHPAEVDKYPIVVLSCRSPIKICNQVPIISVYKLNKFLWNFPTNREKIIRIHA